MTTTNPKGGVKKETVSIRSDIGKVRKDGDQYKTTIILKVVSNNQSVPNCPVRIFKDAVQIATGNTNLNGELHYEHIEPASCAGKVINLKATLTGTASAAETPISIAIPEETVVPAKSKTRGKFAEIKEHGSNGNYFLTIQILDSNNQGKQFEIIIHEENQAVSTILPGKKNPFRKKTDKDGFLTVQLSKFKSKKRIINVRVIGTDLDRTITLQGPKQKIAKGKLCADAGFFANLFQKDPK